MKKILSIVIMFAVLLSLAACGEQAVPTEQETTVPTVPEETQSAGKAPANQAPQTPQEMYGHINQLEPMDGVYKIWSVEGVKNIANHPDGSFELLCTIDLEGAELSPIGTADKPFTGEIKGANFFLKNFTVRGGQETDFGFIGVNQGTVRNLVLEDVTFIPGENAVNIGTLVGNNQGKVLRCNVSGGMTVDAAPEGANCGTGVGVNTGSFASTVLTVDLAYNAENAANVGGLIGCNQGEAEYLETHGKFDVLGENKSVGLFAGVNTDSILVNCVFSGTTNTVNGQLYTYFTGNADDDELVVAEKALLRDNAHYAPLPENVQAVREKVVDTMYKLCSVQWRVKENISHSCTCNLTTCHGVYNADYLYTGIPYNHKSSSLRRVEYILDDEGYIPDWFYDLESYDGFDIYFGADCSSTIAQAWWTVSNSVDFQSTVFMPPANGRGTIAVGDYKCDWVLTNQVFTDSYMLANSEEIIYEAYATMRLGDALVNRNEDGGHTRMAAADPVIVRDQQGKIDPNYSYILIHEQGSPMEDHVNKISSSCKVNYPRNFLQLYHNWYIPVTCEELLTGEMEPAEATLEGACGGYAGMLTGTVKSNYYLDCVTLKIEDSQGQVILDHPLFTTSIKEADYGNNYFAGRCYTDRLSMADFAAVLSRVSFEKGETYSYTVTANLGTYDDIQVHESTFTFGTK